MQLDFSADNLTTTQLSPVISPVAIPVNNTPSTNTVTSTIQPRALSDGSLEEGEEILQLSGLPVAFKVGDRVEGQFQNGPVWYAGVITVVHDNNTFSLHYDDEDREELGIYEKLHILTEPLGTSDLNSTKSPFFSMNFLEGELDSSKEFQTGSIRTEKTGSQAASYTSYSQQVLKIPQLEVSIEYKIAVSDPLDRGIRFEVDETLSTGRTYANDMSVYVGSEEILILAEEGNTFCNQENFDIEVFEITGITGSLGEEILNPLSFIKPINMVENNILLDETEARRKAGQAYGDIILDDSYVEYYINIDVDKEIDKNIICDSFGKIKRQGRTIYSPCGIDIDCPDLEGVITTDIYDSDSDPDNC